MTREIPGSGNLLLVYLSAKLLNCFLNTHWFVLLPTLEEAAWFCSRLMHRLIIDLSDKVSKGKARGALWKRAWSEALADEQESCECWHPDVAQLMHTQQLWLPAQDQANHNPSIDTGVSLAKELQAVDGYWGRESHSLLRTWQHW